MGLLASLQWPQGRAVGSQSHEKTSQSCRSRGDMNVAVDPTCNRLRIPSFIDLGSRLDASVKLAMLARRDNRIVPHPPHHAPQGSKLLANL